MTALLGLSRARTRPASRAARGGRLFSARSDTRGAAAVEFMIAIVPILIFFFSICQMCVIAYVHLIVKHSAFIAARTEAVVHPQMPDAGSEDDVKAGVMMLLGAIPGVGTTDVTIQTTLAGQYEQKIDTVKVVLNYKCTVPLANRVMCPSGVLPIEASASFPNQGSTYQKIWQGS